MADKVKLKDETVKLLRATLVPSQKTGLSVRQCEQEYKGLTGSVLPFRQLGYSTAEDMFSDWHDVVRISYEQGQMVIRARETEETEHLHRMVERQNMSGKDKKVLQRRRYGAHDHYSRPTHPLMRSSHHSSMPPRSHSLQQSRYRSAHYQHPTHTDSYSQRQMPSSHSNSLAPHQTRRTATQIVRGKVKELLMSYPTGLIGSSFEKAFVRRFGQSIQCRAYGFSNFLEMMRAMNDFVSIEDLSSGGYKLHSKANYRKIQGKCFNKQNCFKNYMLHLTKLLGWIFRTFVIFHSFGAVISTCNSISNDWNLSIYEKYVSPIFNYLKTQTTVTFSFL